MPDNLTDQDVFTEPVASPTPGGDAGVWGAITKAALQALANRTRWLKDLVETLTGSSGSIGNITDVDTSGQSEGYVLRRVGATWAASPLDETGMRALQNGSQYSNSIVPSRIANHSEINDWMAQANAAIRIFNPGFDKGAALRLDSVSAGDMTVYAVEKFTIIPNSTYLTRVDSRSASTGRNVQIRLDLFDDADTFIQSEISIAVANSSSEWATLSLETAFPENCASVQVFYIVSNTAIAGEVHYFDDLKMQQKIVARSKLNFLTSLTDNPTQDAIDVSIGNTIIARDNGNRLRVWRLPYHVEGNSDLADWIAQANCSLSLTQPFGSTTSALELSSLSSGDMRAATASDFGVLTGASYDSTVFVRSTVSRIARIVNEYFNDAGELISSSTSEPITTSTTEWINIAVRATFPPECTRVRFVFIIESASAASERHYFQTLRLFHNIPPRPIVNFVGFRLTDNPASESIQVSRNSAPLRKVLEAANVNDHDFDGIVEVDASSGDIEVTLPDNVNVGFRVRLFRVDNSANTVTISADNLVGNATSLSGAWSSVYIYYREFGTWAVVSA